MHFAPSPTRFPFAPLLGMLLAGCLVLSAVAALILFNVQQRAFDPATYEGALKDADLYRQFPVLLASLVQDNLGPQAPAFLQRITPEQWNTVMITLLPPQGLKAMAEDAIAQAFGFLNGELPQPSISLAPLKQSLAGPSGIDAALY